MWCNTRSLTFWKYEWSPVVEAKRLASCKITIMSVMSRRFDFLGCVANSFWSHSIFIRKRSLVSNRNWLLTTINSALSVKRGKSTNALRVQHHKVLQIPPEILRSLRYQTIQVVRKSTFCIFRPVPPQDQISWENDNECVHFLCRHRWQRHENSCLISLCAALLSLVRQGLLLSSICLSWNQHLLFYRVTDTCWQSWNQLFKNYPSLDR